MSTSIPHAETAFAHQPIAATGSPSVEPPDLSPNIDHIITEDGAPVDSVFSEKQQRLLTEPLYSSWQAGKPFVAMANVGLFFAPTQSPFVPDVLLSLDVHIPDDIHPKTNGSYFVWEYGKPPNVVIEIVSNKEGREDTDKLAGYARIGIAFYAIYDPDKHLSDEILRVFRISGMKYHQVTPSPTDTYQFSGINLGLVRWRGEFEDCNDDWLRWIDISGLLIPTGLERANKLADQLRRLGIQPEA